MQHHLLMDVLNILLQLSLYKILQIGQHYRQQKYHHVLKVTSYQLMIVQIVFVLNVVLMLIYVLIKQLLNHAMLIIVFIP